MGIEEGTRSGVGQAGSDNEQSPLLHSTSLRLAGMDDDEQHGERHHAALSHSSRLDDHDRVYDDNGVLSPYHASGRERIVAYLCFLVLGASVLLPWNLLIIVTPYFNYCLTPHDPDGYYSGGTVHFANSFVPLIYTLSNLFLIVGATYSQQKKGFENIERRLFICIAGMAGIIFVLVLSTLVEVPIWIFYVLLVFVTVAGAGVCASLQSSSAALTTIFDDPFFMQGVMSGQGAIGFSVAITQFLSALNSIQKNHQGGQKPGGAPPGAPNDGHALVTSTFNFLVISLLFTFIAGIATYVLIKLPCYEHAMERHTKIEAAQMNDEIDPSEATHVQTQHHKSSIWQVNRKIRDLGWALAFLYTISIGLFPSITMSIASVNPSSTFSSPLLWIPLGFVVFNTADWIGRALPGFQKLIFTDKRKLILASIARTVFIPLMLLCNVQLSAERHRAPFINSDTGYLAVMVLFAVSNGYLTALLMMRAITEKSLHAEEVDVASSIMLIYLTVGLCLGAILSIVLQLLASLVGL